MLAPCPEVVLVIGNVGATFGAYFGTVMAAGTVAGLAGWRAAFFFLAVVSAITGMFMLQFGRDVPRGCEPNSLWNEGGRLH